MARKTARIPLVLLVYIPFILPLEGCVPTQPCDVSEFVVTKTDDTEDGVCDKSDCSLREAIIAANRCPGPQTIQFPSGVYVLSIAGADEDLAATGDLDITDHLTLLGENRPIVDADHLDRVFEIHDPAKVEIVGITIQHGEENTGAGIANHSIHYLRDSVVRENVGVSLSSPGGKAKGGGLFNDGGQMTLHDVQVLSNRAYYGGGIENYANSLLEATGLTVT